MYMMYLIQKYQKKNELKKVQVKLNLMKLFELLQQYLINNLWKCLTQIFVINS